MNPGYVSAIANHLWQSTLFAGLAALLTLALRNNHARVRHGVWLAASCKFLIPLSVLIALGGHFQWRIAREATQPSLSVAMDQVTQPFTTLAVSSPHLTVAPPGWSLLPAALWGIWVCGFIGIVVAWWVRWRRIRAAARAGAPLLLATPIPAKSSPTVLEPGVFGVFRPVLLLPEGIFERLTPAQLNGVIEHELCHVRHRDNLTAAIHMFVETVFWFHPLVWWIGKRMVEERERACDEEALRLGSEPQAYAEGILTICKLYVETSLMCASGVTGANLKRRIEAIVGARTITKLTFATKTVIAIAGMTVIVAPILVGILRAPATLAQSTKPPVFEVTSVKESGAREVSKDKGVQFFPSGRFVAEGLPLTVIIAIAYGLPLQSDRLTGGPAWIGNLGYSIEAAAEKDAIAPGTALNSRNEKIRLMLQALLADRFKLRIHREVKEGPVYEITTKSGGSKLAKSALMEDDCANSPTSPAPGDPAACHTFAGGAVQGVRARAASMSDLVSWMSNWTDHPVIDKTGLSGLFDIETEGWALLRSKAPPPGQERTPEETDTRPTLFQIFDRLGLKLDLKRGPTEMFVIDHVERPTPN
jgi:bla regulator protein BlaR1